MLDHYYEERIAALNRHARRVKLLCWLLAIELAACVFFLSR